MWLDSVGQILFLTAIVLVIFKLAEYVLWPVATLMFERIEQIVPAIFAPPLRRILISAFVQLLIAYWTALVAVWMAIRLIFDPQEAVVGEARETVIDVSVPFSSYPLFFFSFPFPVSRFLSSFV
jgi:hypothetical protein